VAKKINVFLGLGLAAAVAVASPYIGKEIANRTYPLKARFGAFKLQEPSQEWGAEPDIEPLFQGEDQVTGLDGNSVYHCIRPKNFSDIADYYSDMFTNYPGRQFLIDFLIYSIKHSETGIEGTVLCKIFTNEGYSPMSYQLTEYSLSAD
jgi:hypothetical protein